MFRTTIYFDTSFYVSLQRAESTLANTIIDRLQELGVRRVESPELFIELDVSPNTHGKRLLVERLARWTIPPLRLAGADLAWLAVEERPPECARLLEVKQKVAKAHAFSASASQPLPAEDAPILEQTSRRELGIEVAVDDSDAQLAMMEQAFAQLDKLDYPVPLAALLEEMQTFSRRLAAGEIDKIVFAAFAAALPERIQKAAEEVSPGATRENAIYSGVLAGNDRARNITLGRASDKSEKRHRSTVADLEHLAVFLRNADSIDLLMMDGPQLDALDQHAEAEVQHVRDRIFKAGDLPGVIEIIWARASGTTWPE